MLPPQPGCSLPSVAQLLLPQLALPTSGLTDAAHSTKDSQLAVIGIDVDADSLVLWRGRDFRWLFNNLDDRGKPVDFPDGQLILETDTGGQHNAVQLVEVNQANDGEYKLGLDGVWSDDIDYNDVSHNAAGQPGAIADALEGMSNIGVGNVIVSPQKLYPVWRLNVELNGTSRNEIQELNIVSLLSWLGIGSNSGKMTLTYQHSSTDPIAIDASAATIQAALESLPRIGPGNVIVTQVSSGKFQFEFVGALAARDIDQVLVTAYKSDSSNFFDKLADQLTTVTTRTIQAGRKAVLNEQVMNLLNKYINQFFDLFDEIIGMNLQFVIEDNLNFTIVCTGTRAFEEIDLLTFGVDVTNSMIRDFLDGILDITGMFETISVDFYWKRLFTVEFTGDLAEKEVPRLIGDASGLMNDTTDPDVVPIVKATVVKPGKNRYDLWYFSVSNSTASIKIESEECDKIQPRCKWQLYFLPDGEPAGGDPIGRGMVQKVG